MKLSAVSGLLSGDVACDSFREQCAPDLSERRSLVMPDGTARTRGSVVPVRVLEDVDVSVGTADVAKLLRFFAAGSLDAVEVAYIADALQLSDRVSWTSENARDAADWLSDAEAGLTSAGALDIAGQLCGAPNNSLERSRER